MADQGQRTEQPTPRRLEKARQEGQVPSSREFISSVIFLAYVWLLAANSESVLSGARLLLRWTIESAFRNDLTVPWIERTAIMATDRFLAGLAIAGLAVSATALGAHLVSTGLTISAKKLAPDLTRLNPISRLRDLPTQNVSAAIQALLFTPIACGVLYLVVRSDIGLLLALPRIPLHQGLLLVSGSVQSVLWKAAMLAITLGAIDLFRQRLRWMKQMRMSKQEVREEHKEAEGNPLIRMKIRRLQREAARKRMMEQVPKATAVVVNPTHYAVALRYQPGDSGAPKVVAKGQNWLALRIRELAVRAEVPVVENPALARALYSAAEVGQEIPRHLYQAVAEVLAYIYRLTRQLQTAR